MKAEFTSSWTTSVRYMVDATPGGWRGGKYVASETVGGGGEVSERLEAVTRWADTMDGVRRPGAVYPGLAVVRAAASPATRLGGGRSVTQPVAISVVAAAAPRISWL